MCGMHAFKTAFMSIKSNNTHNAVCSTSEVASPGLLSKFYDAEYEAMTKVEENPIMAFEKDFLRFMLSDGASAVFMSEQRPGEGGLVVEWIETISYANRQPACMYMIETQLTNRLCWIPDPEIILPHMVFIEDVGEKGEPEYYLYPQSN